MECFGKFSVYREGKYLPIRNRKAEELLAYLCCCDGRAVKKRMLEELLWADSERGKARESLYKVCGFLHRWQETEGMSLPLEIYREEIYLDTESIALDLREFRTLCGGGSVEEWERAEKLYTAPLLFENSYEWVEEYEAVYDMAYYELLEKLHQYYQERDNREKSLYYHLKLKGFR